mgnify:CR=1 FL=1
METNMQTIIMTQNLTKRYGDKTAVNHLNLAIRKGEVFGLLGPNGAGKTTTILMLLGLTEPSEGCAFIGGLDCRRNPIEVKRRVGYLPDNVGFYSEMTGRQNLRFTGKLNGLEGQELEERIESLLERVGMTKDADRRVGTYSKGMRQRLGVADEPTLGIDPEGMRQLLSLIRELAQEDGRTVLISSHQLYQIQQICDRVGIFVNGDLVACGGIDELGAQVQKENHYSLELELEPCSEAVCMLIRQQEGVEEVEREKNRLTIFSKADLRPALVPLLAANGVTVLHLHQRGGDLDEIYHMYFEKAGQESAPSARRALPKWQWHRRNQA